MLGMKLNIDVLAYKLKKISPYIGSDGILPDEGKSVQNSVISYNHKRSLLLAKSNHVTKAHFLLFHVGL